MPAELLQLPSHIRARLAEAMLASLEEPDAELDLAWGEGSQLKWRGSATTPTAWW